MRIAIFGASSQIAKDLIRNFVAKFGKSLLLYTRDYQATCSWIRHEGLEGVCSTHEYSDYGKSPHEVVVNCIGVGNPLRAAEIGADLLEITSAFDDLVLSGLKRNPSRRYIFLSSGAVYGNVFDSPVSSVSPAMISINDIGAADYYALAKLQAEIRHRTKPSFAIVDLRLFNIFSHTQDLEARFLITDIIRAIRDGQTLLVSPEFMVRDFIHPYDFYRLVEAVLAAPPRNCAVDCYSREPIDKFTLLEVFRERFGLKYEVVDGVAGTINATGLKTYYHSSNKKAAEFGYEPSWSSLEGVLTEAGKILK